MKYLVFPLALMASQATAQEFCADRQSLVNDLTTKYHESQQIVAMTPEGLFIEIFSSAGGAWTLLATRPDGVSCVFAYGQSFEIIAEPLGQDG